MSVCLRAQLLGVLFLTGVLLLPSCVRRDSLPAPLADGQHVGNGGDFLTGLFERGRLQAMRVVERVRPSFFPRYLKAKMTDEEARWFLDHREALIKDISESPHRLSPKLPVGLCPKLPAHTCGCTETGPTSPIHLSYESCSSHAPLSDVGQLLLHESLHHLLGPDEDKAYRIAAVIYGAWLAAGFADTPQPLQNEFGKPDYEYQTTVYDQVVHWTDYGLLVWNPMDFFGSASLYSPATHRWEYLRVERDPELPFHDCSTHPEDYRMRFTSARVNDHLFVFPAEGVSPKCTAWYGKHGIRMYLNYLSWRGIPETGAPAFDSGARLALTAGDRVLVYGNKAGDNRVRVAAFYDPDRDRWESIPDLELSDAGEDYWHPDWVADRFLLWDHRIATPSPTDPEASRSDSSGRIYDPVAKKWSPMSLVNAPPPPSLRAKALVSTGKRFFVFGAREDDPILWSQFPEQYEAKFQPMGGLYDPVHDLWIPINQEGAPLPDVREWQLREGHGYTAMWDGTRVMVLGRDLRFFYPDANRWEVAPRSPGEFFFRPNLFVSTGLEAILWDIRRQKGLIFIPE